MADYVPGGQIALIHLTYPHKDGKISRPATEVQGQIVGGTPHDIACSTGSELPKHASSEAAAVTCPRCKATQVFKDIEAEQSGAAGKSQADREVAKFLANQKAAQPLSDEQAKKVSAELAGT